MLDNKTFDNFIRDVKPVRQSFEEGAFVADANAYIIKCHFICSV